MFKVDDSVNISQNNTSKFAKSRSRSNLYCGGTGSNPDPDRPRPHISCVVRNSQVYIIEMDTVSGKMLKCEPKGTVYHPNHGFRRKQFRSDAKIISKSTNNEKTKNVAVQIKQRG